MYFSSLIIDILLAFFVISTDVEMALAKGHKVYDVHVHVEPN
ncbi:hypothetical protein [Bacillus sp. EB600]|nr:hypothetical protein [Bacillus sp. EB600]